MNREQRKALRERCEAKKVETKIVPVAKPIAPLPMHKQPKKPRLPHQARFNVFYDAEKVEWYGELLVPHEPLAPDVLHFIGKAKGVFGLLSKLDGLYRKHLREAKPEKEQAPVV